MANGVATEAAIKTLWPQMNANEQELELSVI
jgi:hypothetical protein